MTENADSMNQLSPQEEENLRIVMAPAEQEVSRINQIIASSKQSLGDRDYVDSHLQTIMTYDHVGEFWRTVNAARTSTKSFVRELASFRGTCLDIAAGNGYYLNYHARTNQRAYKDGSFPESLGLCEPHTIAKAKKLGETVRHLDYKLYSDFPNGLPTPAKGGKWDVILVIHVLSMMRDAGSYLAELDRVLAPGGMIICRDVASSQSLINGYPDPDYRMLEEGLVKGVSDTSEIGLGGSFDVLDETFIPSFRSRGWEVVKPPVEKFNIGGRDPGNVGMRALAYYSHGLSMMKYLIASHLGSHPGEYTPEHVENAAKRFYENGVKHPELVGKCQMQTAIAIKPK